MSASGAATPTPFEAAMARLRSVRDALNALDLERAARELAGHDAALRAELGGQAAHSLAVSEAEALARAQADLLTQLEAVQKGVAGELAQTRRSGSAARAYLGSTRG